MVASGMEADYTDAKRLYKTGRAKIKMLSLILGIILLVASCILGQNGDFLFSFLLLCFGIFLCWDFLENEKLREQGQENKEKKK